MAKFTIKSLDHLVLTVRSIFATISFYTTHLGMKHEAFVSPKDAAYRYLQQHQRKINLHQSGRKFEPKAQTVQPGIADVCFLTETRVEEVLGAFRDAEIEVLEGGSVVGRPGSYGGVSMVSDYA
ncbi:hypothetical protein BO70DRAFT_425007 [Aspergillus heteromorphus CBS 117.55]|uniref:VOC domain-containing protein n=1 Tax=Aspergillus heteromorphus CBS 117.55 TaxID=1448321 RepID=A0A317X0V1_9EURO|nr:uncharacterized protein BO70DRAFT_425007 [Aspergillus heteromorphus CBS 117.55]PWY92289.1 hypothetical protein BO70DRAFT_425007 [Aspergillus heteromorphus CBS 117.55]